MKNNDYQNWSKAELIKEIERLKKRKKYGLVWEEKQEEVVEVCKDKLPVVKEVKNKEIITDKNKPVNLLIEGDNYHVLSVLNYTHEKKIDVIYIDPPYNTGNKEFVFNDRHIDSEDGYRHSKWLSFMKKRLRLAKSLLKNGGVIFVSIDENELAQLKVSLDDLFNEKNVDIMIWRKGGEGRYGKMKNTTTFRKDHEYILIGYKGQQLLNKIKVYPNFKSKPKVDSNGRYFWTGYIARGERGSNPDHRNYYSVKAPNGKKFTAQFELKKEEFLELDKKDYIYWTKSGIPYRKIYTDEFRTIICSSILLDVGGTYDGKIDLCNVFGIKDIADIPLDNPKPVKLIKRLLSLITNKDSIVLDFFAGSGTTGHAVLELNKRDDGNRQFILCTNNENNICTDVCYPRVKKVIEGYRDSKGRKIEGLGGNLKYFRTGFVDAEPTDKNKKKLTEQATEMLCIKEGTFESILNRKHFKIFKNSSHYTGIIFDQLAIPEFKKTIKDIKGKFSVYVFSLSDETFDEEFTDVKQKIKLSPIPEAILRVYRRIFR